MKADLTINDRFVILSMLPAQGTFMTLKLIRKLRETLSLTETEIKEHNVEQFGDKITWQNPTAKSELEFGDFGAELIRNTLKKLNAEEKLEEQHFNIYEQFIGE